jgi:predicted nucleotidyltransferase
LLLCAYCGVLLRIAGMQRRPPEDEKYVVLVGVLDIRSVTLPVTDDLNVLAARQPGMAVLRLAA